MKNEQRQRLLVQVAKLYYEEDFSQEKIAKILKLSRPYVSKLLNAAKEEGIVRIFVVDPLNVETPLEAEFRERFHLRAAVILPRDAKTDATQRLGQAAARYLNDILKKGATIGTAWGETIYACAQALVPRTDLPGITSVQICGSAAALNQAVYASNIADLFSNALSATSYLLPVPAVVETKEAAALLRKEGSIASIIEKGETADIALFTAGAFGEWNALYRAGYLQKRDMQTLSKKGVVGDVGSHLINIRGEICDEALDARTLAVSFDALKKIDYRICVAQGISKIDSLCGVLNGGIANVLITNEETAEGILRRMMELT